MKANSKPKAIKQKFSWQLMFKQRYLLLMSVPFVIWLIIFKCTVMGMDDGISGCQTKDICCASLGA